MEEVAMVKKRVMVLVDGSTRSKQAVMFALTHVANRGDLVILLHVVPSHLSPPAAVALESLGSICKACKPEVEIEALVVVVQGLKLDAVINNVRKLEVSVLVVSQRKPSSCLSCLFASGNQYFVNQCIDRAECLTMAVRRRSYELGGYLVTTRWQKDFWLLA